MRIRRYLLSVEDLAKVRLITSLGPLAETTFALQTLQRTAHPALFGAWRKKARHRIPPHAAAISRFVAPPDGVVMDLPTMFGTHSEVDEALDRLRGLPHWMLHAEIDYLAGTRPMPGPLGHLAFGDGPGRETLLQAVRTGFAAVLEPYWQRVRAHLETQTLLASRLLATRGLEGILTSHPSLIWQPPVLEMRRNQAPRDPYRQVNVQEYRLEGRGLSIAFSMFLHRPTILHPEDVLSPFILVLPAHPDLRAGLDMWSSGEQTTGQRLAALLGRTRAAVLEAAADGRTTSEIARHLGITAAGASQHTTVLREAGLITTLRHRNTVIHTLTPLGVTLLNGG